MNLSKAQRASLFAKFGGRCAYCGHALPERGWHADHIAPVLREWWKALRPEMTHDVIDGKIVARPSDRKITNAFPERDSVENLFPACAPCNIDKGCESLEGWRLSLERKPEVLRRNHSAWRHAERFGIVAVVQPKVTFYFERISAAVLEPKTPELQGSHDER